MISVGHGPIAAAARGNQVVVAGRTSTLPSDVRCLSVAGPFVAIATDETLVVYDLTTARVESMEARGIHTLAADYLPIGGVHICCVVAVDDEGVGLYYCRRRILLGQEGILTRRCHIKKPLGLVRCLQPAIAALSPARVMLATAHKRGPCLVSVGVRGTSSHVVASFSGAKTQDVFCGYVQSLAGVEPHALITAFGTSLRRYDARGWRCAWRVHCPGVVECLRLQAENAAVACKVGGGVVAVYNGRGELEGRWMCDAGWTLGSFSPLQSKPESVRMAGDGEAIESRQLRKLPWAPTVHGCFERRLRRRAAATAVACRDVPFDLWVERVVPCSV